MLRRLATTILTLLIVAGLAYAAWQFHPALALSILVFEVAVVLLIWKDAKPASGTTTTTFVGRKQELAQLRNWVAADSGEAGRAGIVVGAPGTGKTALLNRFRDECLARPADVGKWFIRVVQVTGEQNAGSTMEGALRSMYNEFTGLVTTGPADREHVRALLEMVPKGGKLLGRLIERDQRPGWQRFLDFASRLNSALAVRDDARLVFVIDPQHEFGHSSAGDWIPLAEGLPPTVRLIVAQRPDDTLVTNADCRRVFKPVLDPPLGDLGPETIDEWYEAEFAAGNLPRLGPAARRKISTIAFGRYGGYPIAQRALINALRLDAVTGSELVKYVTKMPEDLAGLLDLLYTKLSQIDTSAHRAALVLQTFGLPVTPRVWASATGIDAATLDRVLEDRRVSYLFKCVDTSFGPAYLPFHALFSERLEDALRNDATRQQLARAAWEAIAPALKDESLDRRNAPFYELFAAARIAFRSGNAEWFVGVAFAVFPLKLRFGLLDDASLDMVTLINTIGGSDEPIAAAYLNLSTIAMRRQEWSAAEEMLDRSYRVFEVAGDQIQMARVLGNLGVVQKNQNKLDEAEGTCLRALAIDESIPRAEGMAANYGTLGVIMDLRGDPERAEQWYRKALKLYRTEIKDEDPVASLYVNIGILRRNAGDLVCAARLMEVAFKTAVRRGDVALQANAHANLAIIAEQADDLSGAKERYRQAIQIYKGLNRVPDVATMSSSLGRVLAALGEYDDAEVAVRESLSITIALEDQALIARDWRNLGNVLIAKGDFERAEAAYGELCELSESEHKTPTIMLTRAKAAFDLIQGLLEPLDNANLSRADSLFQNLVDWLERDSGTPLVREELARAGANLIASLGDSARLDRAEAVYKEVVSVSERADVTSETRVFRSVAALNLVNALGNAQSSARLNRACEVYEDMVLLSTSTTELVDQIRQLRAHAGANLIIFLGAAATDARFTQARDVLSGLTRLADQDGAPVELGDQCAAGAFNLITALARARHPERVEEAHKELERLKVRADRLGTTGKTMLEYGRAATNLLADLRYLNPPPIERAQSIYDDLISRAADGDREWETQKVKAGINLGLVYEAAGDITTALRLVRDMRTLAASLDLREFVAHIDPIVQRLEEQSPMA